MPALHNSLELPVDEEGLLAQCPRCGYRLRGLPVHNRCPECGLMVDRRWRVFGSRVPSEKKLQYLRPMRVLLLAGVAILLAGPLVSLYALLFWGASFDDMFPTFLMLVLAGCAIAPLLRRPRKFLAIGPDGVHLYHGRDRMEHFEWRAAISKATDVMSAILATSGPNAPPASGGCRRTGRIFDDECAFFGVREARAATGV